MKVLVDEWRHQIDKRLEKIELHCFNHLPSRIDLIKDEVRMKFRWTFALLTAIIVLTVVCLVS